MVTVVSRAKRIFRGVQSFRFIDAQGGSMLEGVPLSPGEMPIGVYYNEPESLRGAVVVTDSSLLIESHGSWRRLPYSLIERVLSPASKIDAHELYVYLRSGTSVSVPIRGGTQKSSDVFDFLRFLDRVTAD